MENLSMYYQNVNGLISKSVEFSSQVMKHDYDVISLTETNFNDKCNNDLFFDDRYIVFRRDRDLTKTKKTKGGGVLIAVKKELCPTRRKSWNSQDAEDQWVTISKDGDKAHLCCVYIPSDTKSEARKSYYEGVSKIVQKNQSDKIILAGDYNMSSILWNDCGNPSDLTPTYKYTRATTLFVSHFIQSNKLQQSNSQTNLYGRVLDLVISNTDLVTTRVDPLVTEEVLHIAIIVKLRPSIETNYYKPTCNSSVSEGQYRKLSQEKRANTKCSGCKTETRRVVRSTSTSRKENAPPSANKPGLTPGETLLMEELRQIKVELQEFKIIQSKVEGIYDEFKEFKNTITFFNSKMEGFEDELKNAVHKLKNIDSIKKKNTELEAKLTMPEFKIDEQERQQKNFVAEIRGIPEAEGENLQNLLFNISQEIRTATKKNDVESTFRAPGRPTPTKTRPIIVRFKDIHLRDEFLSSVKRYNLNATTKEDKLNTSSIGLSGPRTPVYISEHLTSTNKRLLYLAKKTAAEKKFAYVWVKAGRVYVRQTTESRAIHITSENILLTL